MSVFDSLLSLGQTIKVNSGKNNFGLTQKKKNLHVNVASAGVGGVQDFHPMARFSSNGILSNFFFFTAIHQCQ